MEDFIDGIKRWGNDAVETFAASQLAEKARAAGLTNADSIELNFDIEGNEHGTITVDEARVRARANEILAND